MSASPRLTPARLSLSVALALAAGGAFAQQTASDAGTNAAASAATANETKDKSTLEQITVTARQRSESLQDVPIAITAFTAKEIERASIDTPADFVQLTSNVSMVQAQNSGTSFLTIRGITQVRNGEPPVATVIDGVQQISPNQFNQQLYDLDSIEVLKGPQGALYGRNAEGGAILITTKPPGDTFAASFKAGVSNGGLIDSMFSVSGPIGDGKVRYLFAGSASNFDGLINNVYLDKKVDYERDRNFRARVIADLSDDLSIDTQLSSSRTTGGALNYVFQPLYGVDDPNNTSIPINANNRGYDKRVLDHFSVKADYKLPFATLTGIVGYDHINEFYSGDQFPYSPAISSNSPFGPGTDGTQTQYLSTNATQFELRLTSPSDQRLRWIAGAYYLYGRRYLSSTTGIDLGLGILPVKEEPFGPNTINPTSYFAADHNQQKASAVFGQADYDLTERLELAFALRYDREEHTQKNAAPPSFDPYSGQVRSATFDKWQPKLTLTWKANDDLRLYASYGEGFRSGGFNQSGTGAAAASVGLVGVTDLYQPESAKSLEAGFKSRFDDGRLQIDGSVFHTEVNNMLYFVFVGQLGAQVLTNIDKAKLDGYEINAKYRLREDLTVYGGYGYTLSEVKRFTLAPTDAGNSAPYVPRYTSNVGVQYTPRLSAALNGLVRVDYQRIGQQYWDPGNTRSRDAFGLLNLRVGVESHDGTWSAGLWAKNATNTKYNAEYVLGGFAQIGIPRTFGVDFRYNYF